MRDSGRLLRAALAASAVAGFPTAALASEVPAGTAVAGALRVNPIADVRVRFEGVDQGALDAKAVTFRLRAGAEASLGRFTLLAEGEATAAPVRDYNAFPFPLVDAQRRPEHATVADPENAELNRLQLQYKSDPLTVTAGRQRINLDDQRWVGSVGWRQNEQTFDAVRGEARLGEVAADVTYAIAQRTVFGNDAGPRTALDGDFVLAGLSAKLGPVQGKLFSYLLDYHEPFSLANSSRTHGGIVSGNLPLRGAAKLSLRASYARQSDHGENPARYSADYRSVEAATAIRGLTVTAGWERLGSDNGHSVQTPMATLHKFNGWADLFLVTPPAGLGDAYVSVGTAIGGAKLLPGLNVHVAFHQFDSAVGNVEYGTEWDASAGFRLGRVNLLVKYADYDAAAFGSDTRKLWLQAELAL